MIVKDMLPLSLADGEGFREVMGFIEPGYRIPSRKTLTNCLEQQFAEKKAELKRKLATVDVALTTDCWTALTTESYITVTCHYIEEYVDFHEQEHIDGPVIGNVCPGSPCRQLLNSLMFVSHFAEPTVG